MQRGQRSATQSANTIGVSVQFCGHLSYRNSLFYCTPFYYSAVSGLQSGMLSGTNSSMKTRALLLLLLLGSHQAVAQGQGNGNSNGNGNGNGNSNTGGSTSSTDNTAESASGDQGSGSPWSGGVEVQILGQSGKMRLTNTAGDSVVIEMDSIFEV